VCTKPAEHRDRCCDDPVVERPARPRLIRVDRTHAGGEVTYRVEIDGRPWRGWRRGGRRWWACWREADNTAARWSSELEFGTRSAALAALLTEVFGLTGYRPTSVRSHPEGVGCDQKGAGSVLTNLILGALCLFKIGSFRQNLFA